MRSLQECTQVNSFEIRRKSLSFVKINRRYENPRRAGVRGEVCDEGELREPARERILAGGTETKRQFRRASRVA